MATPTKAATAILNGLTMVAAAGDATSAATALTGFGADVGLKITNGATGPTVAGQLQIELSIDGTKYYKNGGPLVGSVTNSAVSSWTQHIEMGWKYIRVVSGSNTGQNTTADVDVSDVTVIA